MNPAITREILPPLPETPRLEEIKEIKDLVEELKEIKDVAEEPAPAVETLKLRVLKEFKACCLIA
jgi:hypothetical protein